MEDSGRRERCFCLLQDQRMMFSCPRPSLIPQNCWEGLLTLEQGVSQACVFAHWPVSPGCHNQLIDVTEAIVQIK